MTTRPYELLARFGSDGKVVGVSVRTITTIDGKDYEGEPKPLSGASDPAFVAFTEQFSASAVDELTALRNESESLQTEVNSLRTEKESLRTDTESLRTELMETRTEAESLRTELESLRTEVAQITEQVADKSTTIATLENQLSGANSRIEQLLAALPWNPRVMEAKHFVARVDPKEMLKLASSSDATVQGILRLLTAYVDNDWPVVLDSPEMQQAIGYLASIEMLEPSRVAELLRDCSREESYVADSL